MRKFRDYILTELKSRLPDVKTIRMFNNQFIRGNDDDFEKNDEQAFDYPAVFVELVTDEINNMPLGISHINLTVRLHVAEECYLLEQVDALDLVDTVGRAVKGMRGSETDTVQFSSLNEGVTTLDINSNNVNISILEYTTVYYRKNSYTRSSGVEKPAPTTLQVDGTII